LGKGKRGTAGPLSSGSGTSRLEAFCRTILVYRIRLWIKTYFRELLNIGPLPAFTGYASRFLAESWDSPNLYWARLADENGLPAVTLNHLVPQLTRSMIEKIFATDLEDWPALLRAMHETGDQLGTAR